MFPESPDCTLYDDTKRNGFWVTGGEPGVIEVLKVWKWPIVHRSKFWPIYVRSHLHANLSQKNHPRRFRKKEEKSVGHRPQNSHIHHVTAVRLRESHIPLNYTIIVTTCRAFTWGRDPWHYKQVIIYNPSFWLCFLHLCFSDNSIIPACLSEEEESAQDAASPCMQLKR